MQADGALEQKLRAYIEVNKNYAVAIKDYKGNWVPTIHTGGGTAGGGQNAAQTFIDILTAKAAKDLGIDATPGAAAR